MRYIRFLPIEPMAKARPRVTRHGTYMPRPYQAWRGRFVHLVQQTHGLPAPIADTFALKLTIVTKSGSMRPDLDNVAGAVLDALQDARVIANDRKCRVLEACVVKGKDVGIQIEVEEIA